jgi:hypothetical protein
MTKIQKSLLIFQFSILFILVLLSPYAMNLPLAIPYGYGYGIDPYYATRKALILTGIIGSVLCIISGYLFLSPKVDKSANLFILQCSIILLVVVLGCRNYPYWVNGVLEVYGAQWYCPNPDPKDYMPFIWFGGTWHWFLLLLHLTIFLYFFGFWGVVSKINHENRNTGLVALSVFFWFCVFGLFYMTPCYLTWILD